MTYVAAPCPTCYLDGGFHDHGEIASHHDAVIVPRWAVVTKLARTRKPNERLFDVDGEVYTFTTDEDPNGTIRINLPGYMSFTVPTLAMGYRICRRIIEEGKL